MDATWQARIDSHVSERNKKLDRVCKRVEVPDSRLNVTSVPAESGILDPSELEITEADVQVLQDRIATGSWTALQVVQAFSKRAVIAHGLVNCLTEVFFDQAFQKAKALDDYYKRTGKTVGPLHGLPISLKDQLNVEGVHTTMGYVSWIDKVAQENSVMVDILESQGAILYVKTNVPFSLMRAETYNRVFGLTSNPHNRALTCGGSSGGEGALVALGGSPLGVGSDIGGSIRIPAAFCGLYGLKPSHGRFPYYKAENSMVGQEAVHSTLGPLCKSLEGLIIFVKSLLEPSNGASFGKNGAWDDRTDGPLLPWDLDPKVINMPWRQEMMTSALGKKPLRVGIMEVGTVRPHPPIGRALKMVRDALTKAGHEVVEWDTSDHAHGLDLLQQFYGADSGKDIYDAAAASGESIPSGTVLPPKDSPQLSMTDLWQLQTRRTEYQRQYLDRLRHNQLDILVGPVAPYAAVPHGQNNDISYTGIYNLLDFASCVFSVTTVDQSMDGKMAPDEPLNDKDKSISELYDVEKWRDAPVCLQAVGRRLNEEWVLGVTQQICSALRQSAGS